MLELEDPIRIVVVLINMEVVFLPIVELKEVSKIFELIFTNYCCGNYLTGLD